MCINLTIYFIKHRLRTGPLSFLILQNWNTLLPDVRYEVQRHVSGPAGSIIYFINYGSMVHKSWHRSNISNSVL